MPWSSLEKVRHSERVSRAAAEFTVGAVGAAVGFVGAAEPAVGAAAGVLGPLAGSLEAACTDTSDS